MKFTSTALLFVFFTAFINAESFAQDSLNDVTIGISKLLQEKPVDYFRIGSYFPKKRLAMKDLDTLYAQSKASNYKLGQVYALNSLGIKYRNKSNYSKALIYHEEALDISIANDYIDVHILCLNLIGVVYRRQDDIRNALDYHQSALSLAKRIQNPTLENKKSISVSENSIGNIYLSLNQHELALGQFQKSIKLQEETNNIRGLAINYQNIGNVYEYLKEYEKAMENYEKSLALDNKNNSSLGEVICSNGISSVLIKQGNYEKALNILNKTYPTALEINNQYYISKTLSNLGWVQLKVNNYDTANKNLNEALEITKTHNIKHIQVEVLYRLAELYDKKRETKNAYAFYKEAVKEEKNTLGQKNFVYVNNLISKIDLQSKISDFKVLENETKIQTLQMARNRNILIITLVTMALLSVALYSVYRQHLLKNGQKILLLEQQALQTQMNPHFIFNALNSIKLYIINNEQRNAVYYLNKFSKLIRNILDVSKVKEVSLREELSTMSLYMSIENIRFNNSIDYSEKIHPDLNTDTIKLPPLVLQPFLENAIWHGLSPKEGEKAIVLSAKKLNENLIEINITDNGIGRKAALKIKENKSLKRNSIGIDLTKERLTTFCNEYSSEFSLAYHDLKDTKGKSTGTRVCLQVPLS